LFEGATCASKVHGAFSADEDELAGDEPRQFVNLENAMGCAFMDHGGMLWSLAPVGWRELQALYVLGHLGKMLDFAAGISRVPMRELLGRKGIYSGRCYVWYTVRQRCVVGRKTRERRHVTR